MKIIKSFFKIILPSIVVLAFQRRLTLKPLAKRECNICGFSGWFKEVGTPPRIDGSCPHCLSMERHRLLILSMESEWGHELSETTEFLHFAPEKCLEKIFRQRFKNYKTADLQNFADLQLNIEEIDLPDETFDIVLANQVLEHVDDSLASSEIRRILKPGGLFVCSVPLIEGWEETYENDTVKTADERWLHFGQGDHVRYYGRDFVDRITRHSFEIVQQFTGSPNDIIKYGLIRGEKIFIFRKL